VRKELPAILLSYAADLCVAGPQYATMIAVLREAASELQKAMPQDGSVCSVAAAVPVVDDDSPLSVGRPCLNCDD
jgi:predicted nuclease with RNAse H fold